MGIGFAAVAGAGLLLAPLSVRAQVPVFDRNGYFVQQDSHLRVVSRVRALCPSPHATDVAALIRDNTVLADSVEHDRASVDHLLDLACVRALLFADGAPARSGPLLPSGMSWLSATVQHLDDALDLDPGNRRAAGLLAVLGPEAVPLHAPAADETASTGSTAPAPLFVTPASTLHIAERIYRAVEDGVDDPPVLRACTSLMLDAGDAGTAHDCSMRALDRGVDSTWHLLRLAWLAAVRRDTAWAVRLVTLAMRAAHDSAARAEIGWHLERDCPHGGGWTLACRARGLTDSLTPVERAAWLAMPDSAARRFFGTPTPTAVVQHFLNVSYGAGTFRVCLPTDPRVAPNYPCWGTLAPAGGNAIDVTAQLDRLWDPATGEAVTLVPYAIAPNALPHDAMGVTLDSWFRQWNGSGERDSMRITTRDVRARVAHPVFAGFLVRPAVSGHVGWSLMTVQSDLHHGGVFQEDKPPLDTGAIAVSDLVLGQEAQQAIWWIHGEKIPLAPQGVLRRANPVHLYFQIRSGRPRDTVQMRLVLYPAGADRSTATPAMQVTFNGRLARGINEIARDIDVAASLKPGAYWFEIGVRDPSTGEESSRATVMYLD